jgi:hypothetical protein
VVVAGGGPPEFKAEAVAMVEESSGKIAQVTKELGFTTRRWGAGCVRRVRKRLALRPPPSGRRSVSCAASWSGPGALHTLAPCHPPQRARPAPSRVSTAVTSIPVFGRQLWRAGLATSTPVLPGSGRHTRWIGTGARCRSEALPGMGWILG